MPALRRRVTGRQGRDATTIVKALTMPYYTALVTLLAVALYFFLATRVAVARRKFGVKHPAVTGDPTLSESSVRT
jgi:hypothetical protein